MRYGNAKTDPVWGVLEVLLTGFLMGVGALRDGTGVRGCPSTAVRAGEGKVCAG